MRNFCLYFLFIFFGTMAYSQEFGSEEGFYIGKLEIAPSLSLLAPEVPSQNLTLPEVNFNKVEKREVNLVAMMEKTRYERESSYIELESPTPNIGKGEKSLIEVTNDIRFHDRSSNYDIYTGEKKIPAYEEMQAPLLGNPFINPMNSRGRIRAYVSPYPYSPFLR